MKSTIANLWNGNIAPGPNCGVRNPEIEKLSVLMDRHRESLDESLSMEQKIVLEKYINCSDEYSCLLASQAFNDGFCLASKLVSEALSENL